MAARGPFAGYPAFGSGLSVYSDEYQRCLKEHNLICSMDDVGSCGDNVAREGFFGLLKRERVNRYKYRTRSEARADAKENIVA